MGAEAGTLNSCLLRFQEKGNLEVLLLSIQSKLRAHNRRLFVPREGCGSWDIDKVSALVCVYCCEETP